MILERGGGGIGKQTVLRNIFFDVPLSFVYRTRVRFSRNPFGIVAFRAGHGTNLISVQERLAASCCWTVCENCGALSLPAGISLARVIVPTQDDRSKLANVFGMPHEGTHRSSVFAAQDARYDRGGTYSTQKPILRKYVRSSKMNNSSLKRIMNGTAQGK